MANPDTVASTTIVDRSGETARFSMSIDPALALAWVADPAAQTPEMNRVVSFFAALGGICDGARVRRHLTKTYRVQNVAAASAGQREERWLVLYEDTVTKALYTIELPCRKTSLVPPQGTDQVDITQSPFSDFVTAFEDVARSPDGNTINVLAIRLHGRNL